MRAKGTEPPEPPESAAETQAELAVEAMTPAGHSPKAKLVGPRHTGKPTPAGHSPLAKRA